MAKVVRCSIEDVLHIDRQVSLSENDPEKIAPTIAHTAPVSSKEFCERHQQGFKQRNNLLMQMSSPGKGGGGGVVWLLSDRDDQSNFWSSKILISGFLGGGSKRFARTF